MTDAHTTPVSGASGLQLIGNEPRAGLNNTGSDNSTGSRSLFSNELERAANDVKMQIDAESGSPDLADTVIAQEASVTASSAAASPVVAQPKADSVMTLASTGTPVISGIETQHQASENPAVRKMVDESEAARLASAVLKESDTAKLPPVPVGTAPAVVADESGLVEHQSVGSLRDADTLTLPETIAAPAGSESKQLTGAGAAAKDSLLAAATSDADKPRLMASSSVTQATPAVEKKDAPGIAKEVEPTVKSGAVSVAAQSQTVAQLPAAVALNATSRSKGGTAPDTDNKVPAARLNTAPVTAQTVAGSLTSPGVLAQNHAYALEMPAPADGAPRLAGGLMTPAGVTTASETANSQLAASAAMVKQVHSDIVEAESANNTVALNMRRIMH